MTHKNIVRYYQAWVEGAASSGDTGRTIPEEEDDGDEQEQLVDAGDVLATDDASERDDDDDKDDDAAGWWSNSPNDRTDLTKQILSSSGSSSGDSTSSSWSDAGDSPSSANDTTPSVSEKPLDKYKRSNSTLSQLLQHENKHGFEVSWYLRCRNSAGSL